MTDVRALYESLIRGWNNRDAGAFSEPFADDGDVIGFDGSEMHGRDSIREQLAAIFADHETAPYVAKARSVRSLGTDGALLRAIAGMIPPGRSELEPSRHAHQTLVAERDGDDWKIVLFQNTPAQFDGRPELVEQFTRELESSK
jgi:uncharacterized protein (TIGR02246 family)